MWRYLIKKGYVRLIFAIGNNKKNITQLSKEVGMTISHLARVLDRWEREDLVIKHKTSDKSSEIYLAEQGKKLNMILTDIYHMANRAESKANKLEEEEWKKSQKSKEKSDSMSDENHLPSEPQRKESSKSEKQSSDPQPSRPKQPTTRKESKSSTKTCSKTGPTQSKPSSDARTLPEKDQHHKI